MYETEYIERIQQNVYVLNAHLSGKIDIKERKGARHEK